MKRKTQRKLANLALALTVIAGLGCVAWILFSIRAQTPAVVAPENSSLRKTGEFKQFSIGDLASLSNTKLQRPLVTPPSKPKPVVADSQSRPKRPWPKVTLESIIASDRAKVAIFSNGKRSFTCERGDKFLNLSVDSINSDDVDLTFAGEKRKFRIGSSKAGN